MAAVTRHRQSRAADPAPPEAIRQNKAEARADQLTRARRVGRHAGPVNTSDYGPGIRLEPIHARDGTLLREADVLVADAPDPDAPRRTIRRARRTDHLLTLLREGTIDRRQADAGERLRIAMERAECSLPAVSRSEVHVAPWDRVPLSEQKLKAQRHVSRALTTLDSTLKSVVLWVLDGATIRGYAEWKHMRHTTAAELLRRGLSALADYYKIAMQNAAPRNDAV